MELEFLWLIPIGIGTYTIMFVAIKSWISYFKTQPRKEDKQNEN